MLAEKNSSLTSSPFWNISLLAFAWALTLSTSTLLTTVGPLSATSLDASKSLAAFTVGVFLIGAALSSVPSGWIFRKYGRFTGFAIGCFCQLVGSALGTLSMYTGQLFWLYLGCLSVGLAQGLGQFYRFSAVEITPVEFKSRAITYVLSGGVIAAFVGPTVANYTIDLVDKDYVGTYLVVALFAAMNFFVICLVRFPTVTKVEEKSDSQRSSRSISFRDEHQLPEKRSTWTICSQPLFIISCTIATLAHTIMVMIMSNVSVDMKNHNYSFDNSSLTLELHFVAMFGPGFFTGKLIQKHGSFVVALVGGFIFAGSSLILAIGTELWNYIVGMILVGIAWNFSFSAGTVMLTSCYRPEEATSVQAVNDFVLFSVAGAGSLLSGTIYAQYGWLVLIYVVSGLMALYLLLFFVALKRRQEIMDAEKAQYALVDEEEDDATVEEHEATINAKNNNASNSHSNNSARSPFYPHALSSVAEDDAEESGDESSQKKAKTANNSNNHNNQNNNNNKRSRSRQVSAETREDRTFSDFVNSFGAVIRGASFTGEPANNNNNVYTPLVTSPSSSAANQQTQRTLSTNNNNRTFSFVEEEEDDLRPVRSMSVA